MNLLSAFGGGLWIIPVVLGIAAIYSAMRAINSMKSGSTSGAKVKWFDTGGGWFSVILAAACIGSIIWMINDK